MGHSGIARNLQWRGQWFKAHPFLYWLSLQTKLLGIVDFVWKTPREHECWNHTTVSDFLNCDVRKFEQTKNRLPFRRKINPYWGTVESIEIYNQEGNDWKPIHSYTDCLYKQSKQYADLAKLCRKMHQLNGSAWNLYSARINAKSHTC